MIAHPPLAIDARIDTMIRWGTPVAVGVSGGKDSQAAALAVFQHLDRIGHDGPRVLVHSDLGMVEWRDSLPSCQRLARHLGADLVVLRRAAGDLMDRWEARWQSSVRRYAELATVTLVLPWSTPALRFCTSELKTHIIAAELRRRFRGQRVINVTGVRRQESAAREKLAVAELDRRGDLATWRPIIEWSEDEVFAAIAAHGLEPHEAYRRYGMSRVSCRFCIMSRRADLIAASRVPEAFALYRRMVALERASTFGFQGATWLADIAPELLSPAERSDVAEAKRRAAARIEAESRVTPAMRYVKGWPTRMLDDGEADLLASVRRTVSGLVGIDARCLDRASIHRRYAELIALRDARRLAA